MFSFITGVTGVASAELAPAASPASGPEVAQAAQPSRSSRRGVADSVKALLAHVVVVAGMSGLTAFHTWPVAKQIRGYVLGPNDDTWMNIWHLWWMRQALWVHPQNPFHSPLLHHPLGADMYWHTLAAAKTAWGAVLLAFMSPESAYSVVFLLSYVLTGYTTWLLLRYMLVKAGSQPLVAGAAAFAGACAFNFSRYHLCQSVNHLNLASMEGIPLYIFFFFRYLDARRRKDLVGAALAALYTMLSEYYYLAYLAVFSVFWLASIRWQKGPFFSLRSLKEVAVRRGLVLAVAVGIACFPMMAALLAHAFPQPLSVYHGDSDFYADAMGFVYPDRWSALFPDLTSAHKLVVERLEGNGEEDGYFIGYLTPLLCVLGLWGGIPERKRWLGFGIFFAVLSLGVTLTVAGSREVPPTVPLGIGGLLILTNKRLRAVPGLRDLGVFLAFATVYLTYAPITVNGAVWNIQLPLIYGVFKSVVPLFARGGMPVRLEMISTLSIAVLLANAAAQAGGLFRRWPVVGAAAALALGAAPTYEYRQKAPWSMLPIGETSAIHQRIAADDPKFAVFTDGSIVSQYEQTRHGHPITAARLSRVPVREMDMIHQPLWEVLQDRRVTARVASPGVQAEMRAYLKEHHIKYYVVHDPDPTRDAFVVDKLGGTKVYDGPYMEGFLFPYVD